MNWNNYPVPHAQVATRVVDGAAVIVLADSGEVVVLNEVGTRVWQLADGSRSLTDIVAMLEREYAVAPNQLHADVEEFVQKMLKTNALTLNESKLN